MRIALIGCLLALSAACGSVYTYSGTVVDGSGAPIELISVDLVRQAPRPFASPKVMASTTADAEGRFSVVVPRRSTFLRIGGWEVSAAEAAGEEYPRIALPGAPRE